MAAGGLWRKICAVMATVDRVEKTGHNKHFNYQFAEESVIVAKIRTALVEHGLAFQVAIEDYIQQGEKTVLRMRFKLVDAETGEVSESAWVSEGADKQDKGIPKAITSGVKYFLLKTFLIPTGDDPEADEDAKPQRPQRPAAVSRSPQPAAQTDEQHAANEDQNPNKTKQTEAACKAIYTQAQRAGIEKAALYGIAQALLGIDRDITSLYDIGNTPAPYQKLLQHLASKTPATA